MSEDWSDRDPGTTKVPGWERYLEQGNFQAGIESGEGENVLRLRQTTSGGERGIIGWKDGETGWGDAWTLGGRFYVRSVSMDVAFQNHFVLAGYRPTEADVVSAHSRPVRLHAGFTDNSGNRRDVRIVGDNIGEPETTAPVEWTNQTWYRYELTHDGTGAYTARIWDVADSRPSEPQARSDGEPIDDEPRVAALTANGARGGDFIVEHAEMDWEGTADTS